MFGRLVVDAPRFDGCHHCGERRITSPVSELLPERVSPELHSAQRIAGHADSRTTKLYDRRGQKVLLEDMERIRY